jgi:4-hydroxybenzoate polyprenyltransferase
MTAMQFAIGALNDLVDAPRDLGRKPGKPLPAGAVEPGLVRAIIVVGLAVGLGLSALSGPFVFAVAFAGLATGFAYDLRLKGTPWAWMAYAVGIPLLPLYAWLGASGALPSAFVVLVPLASVAGAAVAISNALVDVDRDRAARTMTPAVVLGPPRAWRLLAALQLILGAAALSSLAALGGGGLGVVLAVAGVGLAWLGVGVQRDVSASIRERGWELQAVGIATLAAGWVLALADGGG